MLQSRLPQPHRTQPSQVSPGHCGFADQRQRYRFSRPHYSASHKAANDGAEQGKADNQILLLSRAQLDDMMLAAGPQAALQSQFARLARQLEEARADKEKLQSQVDLLTEQLRKAETGKEELQSKTAKLETELEEAQTTNDQIQADNAKLDAELRDLKTRYDALEATCNELSESNRVSAEVNKQVIRDAYLNSVELKQKLADQEKSSEELWKQLYDQKQSAETLEKQLADQEKNNKTLTKELCDERQQNESLRRQLHAERQNRERQMQEIQLRLDDERQGSQILELKNSKLCKQLNKLKKERRKLLHHFNSQSLSVHEAAIWKIENEIGQLAHSIITSGSDSDPEAIQELLTTQEYLQTHTDLQFIPVSFPGCSTALRARAVQRLFAMYLAAHVWTPNPDPSLLTQFVSLLRKLIPGYEHGELRARVDWIINMAAEVWDDLHMNGYSVTVTVDPSTARDGWMAVRDECVDGPLHSDSPTPVFESWCVFPRVEASLFNERTIVLFPGRALFF